MFDAHDVAGGEPIVDQLLCQSDFLTVQAAGTTDNLTAKLSLSLKQLADQLGQFVDFGGLQMAGDGSGSLAWKRSPDKQFDAGANIEFRGFQLGMTGQPAVARRQPAVLRLGQGSNQFRCQHPHRCGDADRQERISIRLTRSSRSRSRIMHSGGVWPVEVQMQGQLQNWPARLAAWLPMDNVQLAGGYIMEAKGVASNDGGELARDALRCGAADREFAVAESSTRRGWMRPAAGSWNEQQRRLQLPSAAIMLRRHRGRWQDARNDADRRWQKTSHGRAAGPMELAGTLSYQGDAGRMRQWFADPKAAVALASGRTTQRLGRVAADRRRGAWRNHHRTGQPRGRRFRGQAIPRAAGSTRRPGRLRLAIEDDSTQPVRIDLQRADGRRRRTRSRRRAGKNTPKSTESSTTIWIA